MSCTPTRTAIDLEPFFDALNVLRRMALWGPDDPFANEVLLRLRLNQPLTVALIEAASMVVAHLRP